MAKGAEQNVMVCRSHIIIYYNRETIRYGKVARQSTYHHKPFFFFPLTISQSSLSQSSMKSFGERVMVMAEGTRKKQKQTKNQAAWLFVQKNTCGWYVASKSPSITPFKLIHSSLGKKHTSGINESPLEFDVDLKRGVFLFYPTLLPREVKTVN